MAKYGGLTGPGSYGFPGWPSKSHGAPSGGGRYNAPSSHGAGSGNARGQHPLRSLPIRNEIVDGRWLLPNYLRIPAKGSRAAKTLVFSFVERHGMKYSDIFGLSVECINEPHRKWRCCGGDAFPFEHMYEMAKSDQPGALYDQWLHFNPTMGYDAVGLDQIGPPLGSAYLLPGAPTSSSPDPRMMDENYVTDGKPTLDTCQISVAGAQNLRAILFAHGEVADGLYVIGKNGSLYGYNAFEIPFFLIQLMVYNDQPGAFCEKHIHGRYPINSSMHILPKKLQELYPGLWP